MRVIGTNVVADNRRGVNRSAGIEQNQLKPNGELERREGDDALYLNHQEQIAIGTRIAVEHRFDENVDDTSR